MPGEDINTTLRFDADITNLKASMQEANRLIKLSNSEFKNASAGMDDWSSSADGLRAKLQSLENVHSAQERKLETLQVAYKKVAAEQGENSAAAIELATKINNQKAAISSTEKEIKDYTEQLDKVESGADQAEKELEELEKAARESGDGFTVMKGAIADLVADGIRFLIDGTKELVGNVLNLGRDFTSTMSEVQAISGASGEELEMLTDTAREWGSKTVFSATEAAEAMKYMAMAGWSVEQSVDGLPGILALAASSGTDLGTASDIVTDALTGMGYAAEDAGRLADVMAAASSNANTNVEMMGGTFKYAAPIIGALGYSMEDAAVSIGLMANAGIKAEQAGTSLRSILTRLAAPPKEAATALDMLGVSITNEDGSMKSMSEVVDDLRLAFNDLSEAEQAEYAKKIAGQEAMSGLLAIVNAAPADYEKLTNAVKNSAGAAQQMSDTMNDNLSGDIAEMESALEELGLTIYDKLEQPLRTVVQWITDNLNPAFNWIVDHGQEIISVIAGIAAGFVAFKTLTTITAITQGFQQFFLIIKAGQGVMAAFNTVLSLNPIGMVAIAIGLLVAAIIALWNKSDAFKNFFLGMWDAIKNGVSSAITWISNGFTSLVKWFTQLPGKIASAISGAIGKVTSWGQNLYNAAKTKVTETVSGVTSWFSQLPGKIASAISGAVVKVTTWGKNVYNAAKTKVTETVSGVTSWFAQLPGKIASAISGAVDSVVQWGRNLADKGKTAASNLVSAVVDGVKSLPGKMLDVGKNLVSGLWNGISNSFTWIKEKISGWVGNVLDFIQNLFGIHSPSTETEWQGKMLVAGYVNALNKGKKDVARAMQGLGEVGLESMGVSSNGSGAAGGKTINLYQTNNSPRALSRREIYRQTHNALAYAGGV